MKKWIFVVFAIGAGFAVFVAFAWGQFFAVVDIRTKDFTLPLLGGGEVRLSQYRGRPVILTFFTPSCSHCWNEAPVLEAIYRKYKDRGLVVLGVGYIGESTEEALKHFVEENGLTYPVAIDTQKTQVVKRYNVSWVPHNVFFDRRGNIVREEQHEISEADFEAYLKEIL